MKSDKKWVGLSLLVTGDENIDNENLGAKQGTNIFLSQDSQKRIQRFFIKKIPNNFLKEREREM